MSLTGGLGNAASVCYKRLASLISAKRDVSYSSTMAWIHCSLSFSLLHSSIKCIGVFDQPLAKKSDCHSHHWTLFLPKQGFRLRANFWTIATCHIVLSWVCLLLLLLPCTCTFSKTCTVNKKKKRNQFIALDWIMRCIRVITVQNLLINKGSLSSWS